MLSHETAEVAAAAAAAVAVAVAAVLKKLVVMPGQLPLSFDQAQPKSLGGAGQQLALTVAVAVAKWLQAARVPPHRKSLLMPRPAAVAKGSWRKQRGWGRGPPAAQQTECLMPRLTGRWESDVI